MTNFIKAWLAAKEVHHLFTPHDRQEWVCPACLAITKNQLYYHHCSTNTFYIPREHGIRDGNKLQPIPDLSQLLGVVQKSNWILGPRPFKKDLFRFLFTDQPNNIWDCDSPEEAILKGILWEHKNAD